MFEKISKYSHECYTKEVISYEGFCIIFVQNHMNSEINKLFFGGKYFKNEIQRHLGGGVLPNFKMIIQKYKVIEK